MSGKYRKDHNCLNCGFHVEEHYCSRCGQPNLELEESFWAFVTHSIAHYFHFDNKFFQTLVPLLSKPGKVTLDYLAGKRARYINPVSMYIFVSIVYFIVVPPRKIKSKDHVKVATVEQSAEQKAGVDRARKELAKLGLDSSRIMKETTEAIIEDIDRDAFREMSFQEQKEQLAKLKSSYAESQSEPVAKLIRKFEEIHQQKNDSTYAAYLARQQTLTEKKRDNILERYMVKRGYDVAQKSEILEEQLERNRSKQYFLFMPLMALFVMFNFRKNHIRYLDHLVFTIHGMTAFFIVSIFVQPTKRLLFGSWPTISGIVELGLVIWVGWYLYQSLKIFYQRSASTTFWRMVWIIVLYGVTIKFSETIMLNILFYLN